MYELINNSRNITNEDLDGMSINEQISLLVIENKEDNIKDNVPFYTRRNQERNTN